MDISFDDWSLDRIMGTFIRPRRKPKLKLVGNEPDARRLRLAALTKERDALRTQLDAVRAQLEALEDEHLTLTQECDELRATLEANSPLTLRSDVDYTRD